MKSSPEQTLVAPGQREPMRLWARVGLGFIGLVVALGIGGGVADWWNARHRASVVNAGVSLPAPAAAAPRLAERPARNTFNATPQQLLDRYNEMAAKGERSMLLPPLNAMDTLFENSDRRTVRHEVSSGVWILMEIDSRSGQPYSLHVAGATTGSLDSSVRLAGALAMVSAAIMGKDGGADVLLKMCIRASEKGMKPQEAVFGSVHAQCAVINGVWMAGLNAA